MTAIAVPVNDARAVLDEEAGEFAIEVRLANGAEVRFSSTPGPERIAELKAAITAEPIKAKPKRRSQSRRKKEETAP